MKYIWNKNRSAVVTVLLYYFLIGQYKMQTADRVQNAD